MFESITMKMIRLFAVAGALIVLVYFLTHT